MERVTIAGPGALGLFIAARLNMAGIESALLDYDRERSEKINREGILLYENNGESYSCKIPCSDTAEKFHPSKFIIVAVKEYDTQKALLRSMDCFTKDTVVISIQNGYKHVEEIREKVSMDRTVFGTTSHGVSHIETGKVKHAGGGQTYFAEEGFNNACVSQSAALFNKAGIKTAVLDNIKYVLWKKLIFNASINGLTAILNIRNGQLPESDSAWKTAVSCFREARDVAACVAGNKIYDVTEEDLKLICRNTSNNISSMLQDVRKGKKTEISSFNGAIIEEGRKQGKETPVNKMIFNLIKSLEEIQE